MRKDKINLNDIIPAGDAGEWDREERLPLFAIEFQGKYHLVPGQDKYFDGIKELGFQKVSIYILPGNTSADFLLILRDLFRRIYS